MRNSYSVRRLFNRNSHYPHLKLRSRSRRLFNRNSYNAYFRFRSSSSNFRFKANPTPRISPCKICRISSSSLSFKANPTPRASPCKICIISSSSSLTFTTKFCTRVSMCRISRDRLSICLAWGKAPLWRIKKCFSQVSRRKITWLNLAWCNLAWCNLASLNLARGNLAWCKLNLARGNLAWCKLNLARGNLAWCNLASLNLAWGNLASLNLASLNLAIVRVSLDKGETRALQVNLRMTRAVGNPKTTRGTLERSKRASNLEGSLSSNCTIKADPSQS